MSSGTVPILYTRSVASDMYAWALTAAYRSGWRLFDPDYALSRDPDIYEKVRRDPVIGQAIEERLHAIAARSWTIEPSRSDVEEDVRLAGIFEDVVRKIQRFSEARYELASAVIRNRTYAYIEGSRRVLRISGISKPLALWTPTRLRDVDRRRIRIVPEWSGYGENRKLGTFLEMFSVIKEAWIRIENPEWFIRHVYNDEEARLGHGRGLLEAIYFYNYAKQIALREGLQGLERWAQGLAILKMDGMRKGSKQKPNSAVANAWLTAIEKTKARHALVVDQKDEVDVKFPSGEGHKIVIEILRYLDDAMTRLITGAVLPSGGGENKGSLARAEVEEGKQESVVQYDRELLDEVLTRDLLGLVFRLNLPVWREIGLGDAECPVFSTIHEKREDAKESAEIATTLLAGGVPLRRDEVYKKTGYTQPAEGDDVFEPMKAIAAPELDLSRELELPVDVGDLEIPEREAEAAKVDRDEAATVNELTLAIERLKKIGDVEMINEIRKEIARRLGIAPPKDLEEIAPAPEVPEEEVVVEPAS